jgi:hypothetical protein
MKKYRILSSMDLSSEETYILQEKMYYSERTIILSLIVIIVLSPIVIPAMIKHKISPFYEWKTIGKANDIETIRNGLKTLIWQPIEEKIQPIKKATVIVKETIEI